MVCSSLAKALHARRADYNARFRLALQLYPQLDGQEFMRFIAECVDPVIGVVEAHKPEATDAVLSVAYDCALQLTGQRLTFDSGRYGAIPRAWREVLPAAVALVAVHPGKVIPAVMNAVHQLVDKECDVALWTNTMAHIAPKCTSLEQLLAAGQVAAWQCGLAHFREGALSALRSLPPALACAILNIEAPQLAAANERLLSDRWFDPSHPVADAMRLVRRTGRFRGFEGLFLQPPSVRSAPGGWLVQSANDHWLLIADAFGATFHRASAREWNAAPSKTAEHIGTRLVHGKQSIELTGMGPIATSALSSGAIACTFAHSHEVAIVAF